MKGSQYADGAATAVELEVAQRLPAVALCRSVERSESDTFDATVEPDCFPLKKHELVDCI